MKSTDLFESMNSIPDELIQASEVSPEAMAVGGYGVTSREKRRHFFVRVTSSGWFVAAVSLIVAFSTVVLILHAGRTNPGTVNPPAGSTPENKGALSTSPLSDLAENGDFSFAYRLLSDPDGKHTYRQTDTILFEIAMTYTGDPFTTSNPVPEAKLVHSVTGFALPLRAQDPVSGKFTFESSTPCISTFSVWGNPEATPAGMYDLIISYGGQSERFASAVTLTAAWEATVGELTFGHSADITVVQPGDQLSVYGYVINRGPAFTYIGTESDFAPSAYLTCDYGGDTEIEIEALPYTIDDSVPSSHTVANGQEGGRWLTFQIPENAPCGSYAMVFSYGDVSYIFAARIEVVADRSKPYENFGEEESRREESADKEPGFDQKYFSAPGTEGLLYEIISGEVGVIGVEKGSLSLEEIRVPAGFPSGLNDYVSFIGEDAFHGCVALRTLYLPKGVEYLGDYALGNCPLLETIYYQGYAEDWENVVTNSPDWNAGAPALVVICRDRTLTYASRSEESVPVDENTPASVAPVLSAGYQTITPTKQFVKGEAYLNGEWLVAEASSWIDTLLTDDDSIPTLALTTGRIPLTLTLPENMSGGTTLTIYDENLQALATDVSLSDWCLWDTGIFYIVVRVTERGRFISADGDSQGRYEQSFYDLIVRLFVVAE